MSDSIRYSGRAWLTGIAQSLPLALLAATGQAQSGAVVNNPAPTPNAPTLRISAQPVMRIGTIGDAHYELDVVADADLSATGKLLIATGSGRRPADQLRLYDKAGKWIRNVGGRGAGPGEYTFIAAVWMLGSDSMAIYDNFQSRVSTYDSAGVPARTVAGISPGASSTRVRNPRGGTCCFADWSYLRQYVTYREQNPTPGLRDTIKLFAPGTRVGQNAPVIAIDAEDAAVFTRIDGMLMSMHPPFSPVPTVTVSADHLFVGLATTFEYKVYDRTGQLIRTVRADVAPKPVTAAMVAKEREPFERDIPARAQYLGAFDKLQPKRTLPAYRELHAERDGTVWIQGYEELADGSCWWARFDPSGHYTGTVVLPPPCWVLRFAREHVILGERDADGFTTLRVHRIVPIGG